MEVKKYKLGEIATIIPGYAFKSADFGYGENIVIKIKDIIPPSINILEADKVGYTPDDKFRLEVGDYVMAMTGATIGKIGRMNIRKTNVFINQRVCKFIPNEHLCNKDYLYYLLNNECFTRFVTNNIDSKLAQPNIGHPTLYKFEHLFPPIIKQKQIASVLSNIDSKIELNRAINQNLEAMAKQLYDYWFVQFDFPDENGKPYKSSGGNMVWNDALKREIPKGWNTAFVKDIAITYSGGTPKSTNAEYYDNGKIAWINSGELNSSIITKTTNYITESGLNNSSAKLYPCNSILVAMYGATAGKVSLLTFEACSNQAVCGVMPIIDEMLFYVYLYISSLYNHFITLSTGSARDNISQDTIKNILLPLPTNKIAREFNKQIRCLYQMMINNCQEIDILTKQRDELLPLLMNGQVSVNSDLSDD